MSRHVGAIAWAKRKTLTIDRWVAHLNPAEVEARDIVIGSLPVNLAAEICERGAHYFHLSIRVPPEWRGRELSMTEMKSISAELKAFHVEPVPNARR